MGGPMGDSGPNRLQEILPQLAAADTAFIVHDLDVVAAYIATLEAAFPTSVNHAVAIKTMPHERVLRFLATQGMGLEAASFEEVEMAGEAGVLHNCIVFDSPVKTQDEIDLCMERFPGMLMNANSLAELDRYGPDCGNPIGLRVNPLVSTGAAVEFDVSGAESKFGVSVSRRQEILAAAERHDFTALHMHIGSGLSGIAPYLAAVGELTRLAAEITSLRGQGRAGIEVLDIGGGLAAEPLTADMTMMNLGKRLAEFCPELFEYEVWTEFGQWVHANAGWAATRVEYVEERSAPTAYLHLGADYFMRQVHGISAEYTYAVYGPDGLPKRGPRRRYDLAGPLCHAADMVDRGVSLGPMEPGDWLVIDHTGANTYGLWSRHCSRALPKVFGVQDGVVSLWDQRRRVDS
jgi:diaminopimelate decarboxylase